MKRWLRQAAAAALAVGGAGAVGCVNTDNTVGGGHYRNWVDPCWPERYNAVARAEVMAPFANQVHNGHVLNQTVWNWYFETEMVTDSYDRAVLMPTDRLNSAGMAKLDSLARARPAPDPKIYLQAARDLPSVIVKTGPIHLFGMTLYPLAARNATAVEAAAVLAEREALTARRAAAVQKYLAGSPSFAAVSYEIWVHDPAPVGMPAEFAAGAYRGQFYGYRGGLTTGGPIQSQSTGANQPTPTTVINAAPPVASGGGGGGSSGGGSGGGGGSSGGGSSGGGSGGGSGPGSQ